MYNAAPVMRRLTAKLNSFHAFLLLTGGAAACGAPAAPVEAKAPAPCPRLTTTAVISASARSNAGASGDAYPVQVRVYQLASDASLRAAAFDEVWQDDAAALGADLVKVEELTVFPESSETLRLDPPENVNHVAFVALFREPQGRDWYTVYDVTAPPTQPPCPAKGPSISVLVDRMQIKDGAPGDLSTDENQSEGGSANEVTSTASD